MPFLRHIYSLWQRQNRFEQISWIGLLLFLSYLAWHLSFIHGLVPGPYHLAIQFQRIFLPGFWCLVLAIVPASVLFPVTTLRGIKRRWSKFLGLMLLGIISIVVLIPILFSQSGPMGLLGLLILAILFDIWWILILISRFPQRVRTKSVVAFLVFVVLLVSLIPVGGFSFVSVDSLKVKDWNKHYHAGYMMSMDIQGQLTLFECGPVGLFCRQVYRYCDNLGPLASGDVILLWVDDRLSLSFPSNNKSASEIYAGKSPLYQRSQDTILIDTPSFDSESLRDSSCRFSF
ncbi:hypothetical protein [Leptothoe spongobia]|uniref:Uncharacterized protein n=1 Tax=Leptothoe spongobia TAU-MAC 1115 TaxID=1967444 RepID=A0A947DI49_9CYAN|nr:hypothetical protein [Leptothoe spongobia]MBT9317416.1 hypothetical protein [Leptothoe spongobia TAU-MAC 1115]